jgi:hypothetical protein
VVTRDGVGGVGVARGGTARHHVLELRLRRVLLIVLLVSASAVLVAAFTVDLLS